jgi:AcrR family transcriptional regulator
MDEDKRQRILLTAMQLFNKTGFHATPTSQIAKESKVSVGTLFNYFPSKEVLIREIYTEIKIHSKESFLDHIKDCYTLKENLENMWSAIIMWGLENPDEFNYLELFIHSPFMNSFLNDKVMGMYTKFRTLILKSISPSTICIDYPEFSMMFIDNAIHATTRFMLQNEIDDIKHFISSSFDLLWNGFSYKNSLFN